MFIVHVFAHVKPDQVEAFRAATVENARNSNQEPGIARFDVIQQQMIPRVLYWSKSIEQRMTQPDTRKQRIIRNGVILWQI